MATGGNLSVTGTGTFSNNVSVRNLAVGIFNNKATFNYAINAARVIYIPALGADRYMAFIDQAQNWADTQDFTAATVSVANASDGAHALNRSYADGRYGRTGANNDWTGTTQTFSQINVTDIFNGSGFSMRTGGFSERMSIDGSGNVRAFVSFRSAQYRSSDNTVGQTDSPVVSDISLNPITLNFKNGLYAIKEIKFTPSLDRLITARVEELKYQIQSLKKAVAEKEFELAELSVEYAEVRSVQEQAKEKRREIAEEKLRELEEVNKPPKVEEEPITEESAPVEDETPITEEPDPTEDPGVSPLVNKTTTEK